ncbi:hypothetical protein BC939DRAFT_451015 [Gamsiella multidivaricata]|uniref:uncharacterized protein n=1 Tax=Gamsiella multidivaricata TaxID=101098 RepID=UPI00221F1BCF|nr:uncharacterized protein BC939DRAFT_451015 [Gamsiella multidivaricata]KAI7823841.1 hypothetical protein BC939DRAFT_451015 [Gamsiella multidivaricata]
MHSQWSKVLLILLWCLMAFLFLVLAGVVCLLCSCVVFVLANGVNNCSVGLLCCMPACVFLLFCACSVLSDASTICLHFCLTRLLLSPLLLSQVRSYSFAFIGQPRLAHFSPVG